MTTRVRSAVLALALVAGLTLVADGPAATAQPTMRRAVTWCTGNHWGQPRPVPHLEHQQRVVKRVLRAEDREYAVKRARPTHFGVVALVSGDVKKATAELRGVEHVVSWTGGYLSDFPANMRMGVVLVRLLEPVMDGVRREVRGIPGRVWEGYAIGSGAVVLAWKTPVPAEVQELDGIRASGAEVRVVARPYSLKDLDHAADDLLAFLDERDVAWSSLGPCASASGLDLSVPGDVDDLTVTRAEIEEAAGMPVLVSEGYSYPARGAAE